MNAADLPPDADLSAAELAFGLVEGDERIVAEARLARDPAFATAHDRWVADAVTLVGAGEETPDPAVWRAIQARLPANGPGVALPDPALRRWQFAALAAALVAVAFGVVTVARPDKPARVVRIDRPAQAPLVAVLTGADERAVLTLNYDRASGRLTTAPRRIATGDKVAELWVIPPGGQPRAIGIIPTGQPIWRRVPPELRRYMTAAAVLAVSLEPAGGSPTGQPTGPVILSAKGAFAF